MGRDFGEHGQRLKAEKTRFTAHFLEDFQLLRKKKTYYDLA